MAKNKQITLNIDKSFFNEAYLPYLGRNERYQVFYGGSGSGKSYFLANNLIIELMKKQQKLLVVREMFSTIRDSVYAEIISALTNLKLIDYCDIRKSNFQITLPNGSIIIFKGADDENKLLSISGIDMVWVEEADGLTKEIFNQLELRLRGGSTKKRFFLSFNPISNTHWLKSEFFDYPKDDSLICHTTYKDNKFLDEQYIKTLEDMKVRNPQKYQVYALGKWGTSGKVVYTNWKIEQFDTNEIIKSTEGIQSAFGMDFGYVVDPTTLIATLVDVSGRKIYIFDELYEHGLLNNEIADYVIRKGYSKEKIIADSAEKKSITELKNYGLSKIRPAKKGANSINHGIQYISQFEIIVHPKCSNTINELENYGYRKDRRTGEYTGIPVDNYNHIMDALRYALEPFSMKREIVKGINKRALGL